jgi:hypothetical protein
VVRGWVGARDAFAVMYVKGTAVGLVESNETET